MSRCAPSQDELRTSINEKRKRQSNLRKAPGAPVKFKSSYILFIMAHRGEIKKELGVSASVSIMHYTLSIVGSSNNVARNIEYDHAY